MARLPDSTVFGGIDSSGSGRQIATYDPSGYARGAAAEAAGVEALGQGIEKGAKGLAIYAKREQDQNDQLELARAKSEFLTKKVETDELYKDDKEHESLVDRYGKDIDKVRAGASSLITNPRARELFDLQVSDDVAKAKAAAGGRATSIWKDNTLADANERLETIRNAALKSSDPVERAKLVQSGNDLISSLADKNIITSTQAVSTSKEWTVKYAAGAISMLPAEDRVKALGGFEQTLINRESSGRPGLVNQLGYAGLYQFGAPRVADLGIYKPGEGEDIKGWSTSPAGAAGKWSGTFNIPGHPEVRTLSDFLKSPDAQKTAFQLHTAKMDQEAKANGLDKFIGKTVGGVEITREGLHAMMHLGGAGGAKRALESDGKDSPKDANGTSVIEYAKLGSQSGLTKIAGLLPEDTRVRLQHEAEREVAIGTAKAAAAQSELWERKIIDASAGAGVLPNRKDIETDPALDEPRRNVLLRQHDAAAKDVLGLNNFMTKFKDPTAGPFNPYDKDEAKYADLAYRSLGGDTPALQAVVGRTGILPKSAAAGIKGALVSSDPTRVSEALTLTSNLITNNPNILIGVEGKTDIENTTEKFRHYVDDLGMTAQDAAKTIIRDQSPEYQAKTKARIKAEDVDAKIKKELTVGDLASAFDQSWVPFNDPKVAFSVGARQQMFGQYAELVKDAYLDSANGDMAQAKKIAANQLKKTWGVSTVNGSSVVMQYPPEKAPIYAGFPDAADRIAKQAMESIKADYGAVAERGAIRIIPIPGVTAAAYKSGQPVPYDLQWTDKNQVVHMMPPGKGFVADPVAMRGEVVAERKAVVEAGQVAADRAGDEKLLSTPLRLLSQKQRERKAELIAARDAETAAAVNEAAGAPVLNPAVTSAIGKVFERPSGRLGTR